MAFIFTTLTFAVAHRRSHVRAGCNVASIGFQSAQALACGKTTIVIMHDLSQIEAVDFVYVLKEGRIVEQGYRGNLGNPKCREESEFCSMLDAQIQTGGYLPEKNVDDGVAPPVELLHESDEESVDVPFSFKHQTIRRSRLRLRRATSLANWMFDAITDLTSTPTKHQPPADLEVNRMSRFIPPEAFKA